MTSSSSTSTGPLEQLTVAIIACDNERTIGATIASVADLAKQVVVVDSGSTDSTIDICRAAGAEVIAHEWEGHVRQKQFALEQCTTDWVLSLDSDEAVEPELAASMREAIERDDDAAVAGYEVNRITMISGKALKHTWQPEWRVRLVRRERAKWGGYDPHDQLIVAGSTRRLTKGNLAHDSYGSTADMIRKHIAHGLRAAESYHRMGRRVGAAQLLFGPVAACLKQLVLKGGWRDGWRGLVASLGMGMNVAAKYMQLMEMSRSPETAEVSGVEPAVPGDDGDGE